nr:MAG TPA: hypothetical protein [Bacteriophage sp.]
MCCRSLSQCRCLSGCRHTFTHNHILNLLHTHLDQSANGLVYDG